jgi:hypothetical protein
MQKGHWNEFYCMSTCVRVCSAGASVALSGTGKWIVTSHDGDGGNNEDHAL